MSRPKVDPAALTWACDLYAELTGDCDDLVMGAAILVYLEAVLDHQADQEDKWEKLQEKL